MKVSAPAPDTIDIRDLRVGMFVHLDLGWMAHPFPLSSFRITTAAQIATIRTLGLSSVRWSRDESDPEALVEQPAPPPRVDPESVPSTVPGEFAALRAADEAPGAAALARAERVAALNRQREAQRVLEKQYGEASQACKQTFDLVAARPLEAREQARALTQALCDKMVGEQDLCIRMLVGAIGDKASMHAMNVGVISLLMGRRFDFSDQEMLDLGSGALLHDIGKLELPQRLSHAGDHLSASELRAYQEHVELGVAQAKRMGLSEAATAVIAQHHELADGSGFPQGLNSDKMTPAARIVSLVNRFDDLCNPHLHARALTPHETLALMFAQWRSQFDTTMLGTFIRMMGVYPPGSLVQLTDDRYGLVMAVNSARPLKPSVLVHDGSVPRDEALVLDLEAAGGLGIRRSLKPQQLPPAALAYLAPTERVSYFFEPAAALEAA